MKIASAVRKPAVAGAFYPAAPERLKEEIESYLEQVSIDRTGEDITALVAPHAGYMYSGPVAAYAYHQVRGKSYDTVVVISPAHRDYFKFTSVFAGAGYETPLGFVPVDRETVEALDCHPEKSVRASGEGHLFSSEHALEVHLPFLQVVLSTFRIVPIVMGSQERADCLGLGRALGEALSGKRALVVASSDLSHFHSQKAAVGLDEQVVARINAFDPEGLLEDIRGHKSEACGAGPIAATLWAARSLGATHSENLKYATSGDTSGDFSRVVGYTATIIYR